MPEKKLNEVASADVLNDTDNLLIVKDNTIKQISKSLAGFGEVQLRIDSGYIQWRGNSYAEWKNVISIEELKVKGDKGDTGMSPTIAIGEVTTVDSSQNASATIVGTTESLKLNLSIPRGIDAEMTPQLNIFANSDFKTKIINQQGLTEYTEDGLTINGWVSSDGMAVYVRDGYMQLYSFNDNVAGVKYSYWKPIFSELPVGTYTVAVHVKEAYGLGFRVNNELLDTWIETTEEKVVSIPFTVSTPLSSFELALAGQLDASIYSIKLEVGDKFTGMPAYNEALELLKCQTYTFFYNIQNSMATTGSTENLLTFSFDCPVVMSGNPTLMNTTYPFNLQLVSGGTLYTANVIGLNSIVTLNNKIIMTFDLSEAIPTMSTFACVDSKQFIISTIGQ